MRRSGRIAALAAAGWMLAACNAPQTLAPEPTTIGVDANGRTLTLRGRVEAIDNGCHADGECAVTLDGIRIVTLRGWSHAIWGERDPDLSVGDRAEARCRQTRAGCTLEGDAGYYVRKRSQATSW